MIYVVNFANELYKSQQQACTESAYRYGKVDKVIEYSEKDLPDSFFKDNPKITSWKSLYSCTNHLNLIGKLFLSGLTHRKTHTGLP